MTERKPDASSHTTGDWIEWKGGECPVAGDVLVIPKLRDGYVWQRSTEANLLSWDHIGTRADIIAYRVCVQSETGTNQRAAAASGNAQTHCAENKQTAAHQNAEPQGGEAVAESQAPSIRDGDAGVAPRQPAALQHLTPRTDAEAFEARKDTSDKWQTSSGDAEVVDADFARQLERENAELRAQLAEARRTADYWKAEHLAGNAAIETAERQRDEAQHAFGNAQTRVNFHPIELATARADERERIAAHFEQTHEELWTPQIADMIRALKESEHG